MPNPFNNQRGEHWDTCAISGETWPVSEMMIQRGRRVAIKHADLQPNADFFRSNMDIMETDESPPRLLPDTPLEEIAP